MSKRFRPGTRRMPPTARPWRFVVLEDYPEQGLRRGDIITHTAGRDLHVHRRAFGNAGMLLGLWTDGVIADIDAVVGAERAVIEAMEAANSVPAPTASPLRLIRGDAP